MEIQQQFRDELCGLLRKAEPFDSITVSTNSDSFKIRFTLHHSDCLMAFQVMTNIIDNFGTSLDSKVTHWSIDPLRDRKRVFIDLSWDEKVSTVLGEFYVSYCISMEDVKVSVDVDKGRSMDEVADEVLNGLVAALSG